MATKKQTPQQFTPKRISNEEPDKSVLTLTDDEVIKKAFADGWLQDNHPLESKRFFRKGGDVAFDVNDLRRKLSL